MTNVDIFVYTKTILYQTVGDKSAVGPQNSDPKDPNTSSVQPDLSSVLSEPSPTPPPTPPPPEPSQTWPEPEPTPLPYGTGPTPEPPPSEPAAEPSPTPPIDSGLNPGFNWSSPISPPPPPEQYSSPTPIEGSPTDLSQLATQSSEPQNNYTQSAPTPETLIVPSTNITAEPVTLQAESGGRGIPKWVWGVGGGLLLLVIGASAYFILGIGQVPKPASIPATQQQQQLVAPPAPSPVTQTPAATQPEEGFGTLPGGGQATSAADLLRQRQQQAK